MLPFAILWPTFALVLLIFVVWMTMHFHRGAHLKRNPPTAEDFATGESGRRYFAPVDMAANNLANLFEMPVLYFALVALLLGTRQAFPVQVVLAWLFVALRAIHSFLHIGPRKVKPRYFAYLASCIVLAAMWIGFFLDMAAAAHAYHQAMAAMGPLS